MQLWLKDQEYTTSSVYAAAGDVLFFQGGNTLTGVELWKCEGPDYDHAVIVSDINPGPGKSFPTKLTVVDDVLFFQATDGVHGYELWKCEGPDYSNVVMVEDIAMGPSSSTPSCLTVGRGVLFFRANEPTNGTELWKCEGPHYNDAGPGQGYLSGFFG